MSHEKELQKQLQRLEKFNDPVMLIMIFLTLPGVILATLFSSFGDGTLVKAAIAACFLFFTWLAFKVSSMIKRRVEHLQSQLNEYK